MALIKVHTLLQWAAADTKSVAANTSEESDVFTLDVTCIKADVLLKADAAGTPGASDVLYVHQIESTGDPDGSGTGEYEDIAPSNLIRVLDTSITDPRKLMAKLNVTNKTFKIVADGTQAVTVAAITISGRVTEHRSS